jgi:phosphate transport system ATP-binding protein
MTQQTVNTIQVMRSTETSAAALIDNPLKLETRNLSVFYGTFRAIAEVSMPVRERTITAIIGPSGCGKSTLIRSLNRMNDLVPKTRVEGEVLLDGENLYGKEMDVVDAPARRHGLPTPQSLSQIDLRQHRLRREAARPLFEERDG